MARRKVSVNRLIAVLGVLVLVLGAVSLYAATRGARFGVQPTPREHAVQQLRGTLGRQVDVNYLQEGRGRVVCGYAEGDVAFISRPNRLLLSTDPLRVEFEAMMAQACPGFLVRPAVPE